MGFGVPLDHWFRGELKAPVQDLLLSADARCAELFRPEAMRHEFDQHQRGEADHSSRLWALLEVAVLKPQQLDVLAVTISHVAWL